MFRFIITIILTIIGNGLISAAVTFLPKVEILGKQFYIYETKKGDSIYGVAVSNGWDQDLIKKYNPELKSPYSKGESIYYPVENSDTHQNANTGSVSQLTHYIEANETVYGISKKYGVSPEEIYKLNPGSEYGIKAGNTLIIPTGPGSLQDENKIVHKIKEGETLYGLAQRYNTRVEDIMRDNLGISEINFKAGDEIKITPNSRKKNLIKETVEETEIVSFETYKVGKNDTWGSIASKKGIDEDVLKSTNSKVKSLEKGTEITIPTTRTRNVEKLVPEIDPRESSPEGRMEIFEEIQKESPHLQKNGKVKSAIVLSDPESNKDMEFLRGFLTAVNEVKRDGNKISVKVINGTDNENVIIEKLNEFEPDIIFNTSDKNIPEYLQNFSQENICYLVDVFDTKGEGFKENNMEIQLLTPSEYFNSSIGKYIEKLTEGNTKFMIAGESENGDSLLESLISIMDPSGVETISINEIKDYDTESINKVIIYGTPTKKADVKNLLGEIIELRYKSPATEIITIGRPSWITLISELGESFSETSTLIPSRFYFDSSEFDSKEFINDYSYLFGHTPLKSYPVYGASGYDTAKFFINAMIKTGGNLRQSKNIPRVKTLQNDYLLYQDNDKGYYNPIVYILKYNQNGTVDKIELK